MFACLYLPPPASSIHVRGEGQGARGRLAHATHASHATHVAHAALVQLARDFSPRVETHAPGLSRGDCGVMLDISGLGSLIGEPRTIGEELRRAAADAGLRVHIAIAATSTASMLLAQARAGLTVIPRGEEANALAPLPLELLDRLAAFASAFAPGAPVAPVASHAPHVPHVPHASHVPVLKRWGLRTLGDLAALPSADLSARLGQDGLRWRCWARGEETRPLVPAGVVESFEGSLDLEWPIDGLEPLSFVLARLLEPLCDRLERQDRGAVALQVALTLVTRERHARSVDLPAPMRDARVLRTLALLDLEANPAPAAIDRVAVRVDVAEGRVLQFGLFARALPADTLATLMARLGALMGSDRVGAQRALVDTYRPGACAMVTFEPPAVVRSIQANSGEVAPKPCEGGTPSAEAAVSAPSSVLRRFRRPIPARVTLEQGRPVRVTTDRRGFGGGRVERCDGPWRSSGDWWKNGWNCDEWEVVLSDGGAYRISQARPSTSSGGPEPVEGRDQGAWVMEGMLD